MYITWTNPDYSIRIGLNTRLKVDAQNVYAAAPTNLQTAAMKKYHGLYWLIAMYVLLKHIDTLPINC